MSDKVIRFPGAHARRNRLDKRAGIVRCDVSDRWLQLPEQAYEFHNGTYLSIDVMTDKGEGKPRKLCELVLIKEELLAALEALPIKR